MLNLNSSVKNQDNISDSLLWDIWLSRLYLPALAVADKIGLFTHIHNNESTKISDTAKSLNYSQAGIEALIYFIISIGLINYKHDDLKHNELSLTPIATKYLLPEADNYWGYAFIRIRDNDDYKRMFNAITGKPAQFIGADKNKDILTMWKNGNVDPATAEAFAKIMHSTIYNAATLAIQSGTFANVNRLLDIGGGSGCFSELFIKQYPSSTATIFELPSMCDFIASRINDPQIKLIRGNFFIDEFPNNHDAILFSNILHDWELNTVKLLLKKAYQALPKDGRIFIHEMLLNDDKCGHVTATAFNLLMYINHGSQQFTRMELYNLLECAGFKNCDCLSTHPYYSLITAQK